ncbi:hypothetical protein F5148DRAFT_1148453 [Russula earlei]|uniref:Uncharacterized protein n=1 Tax=Russula earlei TaxID=71964 RepID=A0ACC0UBU3_9AGAM|nr:hypothetical protein F5148DRAFT_1148453 [Russula earlei]
MRTCGVRVACLRTSLGSSFLLGMVAILIHSPVSERQPLIFGSTTISCAKWRWSSLLCAAITSAARAWASDGDSSLRLWWGSTGDRGDQNRPSVDHRKDGSSTVAANAIQ